MTHDVFYEYINSVDSKTTIICPYEAHDIHITEFPRYNSPWMESMIIEIQNNPKITFVLNVPFFNMKGYKRRK